MSGTDYTPNGPFVLAFTIYSSGVSLTHPEAFRMIGQRGYIVIHDENFDRSIIAQLAFHLGEQFPREQLAHRSTASRVYVHIPTGHLYLREEDDSVVEIGVQFNPRLQLPRSRDEGGQRFIDTMRFRVQYFEMDDSLDEW